MSILPDIELGEDQPISLTSCRAVTLGGVQTGPRLEALKLQRDAALLAYKQSVKEVHEHAANVALLDMYYIEALRHCAHLVQD